MIRYDTMPDLLEARKAELKAAWAELDEQIAELEENVKRLNLLVTWAPCACASDENLESAQ